MRQTHSSRLQLGLLFVLICMPTSLCLANDSDFNLVDLLDIDVVSVSKTTQKASGAPAPVTVISADDIAIYGYRTLAEALASVRGYNITSDRIYSYAGVRGFAPLGDYNDRLLLMIDGIRVNDNLYDQAMLGSEFSLDLNLVDRIEIVHGPGSSIYGSNALFAVVNVITRKGANVGNRITLQVDSLRQQSLQASLGGKLANGGDYLLTVSGEQAPGETLDFPEFSPGTSRISAGDGLHNQRLFGKFELGGLKLTLNNSRREQGNPAALSSGTLDSRNALTDEQTIVDLAYSWRLGHSTDANASLFWGRHTYRGDYVYDTNFGYAQPTLNRDNGNGRWWGSELKFVTPLTPQHRLVYGLEAQRDSQLRVYDYDVSPYALYFDSDGQASRIGLYAQDDWQARQDLMVTLGARLDRLSHMDDQISPRLAMVWSINANNRLKVAYGSAFRAPNASENFWQNYYGPDGSLGVVPLQAEHIDTLNANLEHYAGVDLRLSLGAYFYRMRDLIDTNPNYSATDTNPFANFGSVKGQGLESEVEKLFFDGSHLRASLSLQQVDNQDGSRVLNSPRWLFKLNYDRALIKHWFLGIDSQIHGPMNTNLGRVSSDGVVNLTLSHRPRSEGWEIAASIRDLFDSRPPQPVTQDVWWVNRDTVPAPARSLRLSLGKKF